MILRRSNQAADWLLISRPIGVTAILGTGVFILRGEPFGVVPLLIIVFITCGLSLLYWFALRRRVPLRPFMWSQLTIDVLLATAIVSFSGGAESQFSLLYFVPVIAGAMFLFTPGSFTMALLSSATYSLLLIGEYMDLLPWLQQLSGMEYEKSYIFLRGYMHVLFFFLVAAMGGYLAERLRKGARELEEVRVTTEDILENMGAGVITVDTTGCVVYFNRAAGTILDCDPNGTRGRMLEHVMPEGAQELAILVLRGLRDELDQYRHEIQVRTADGRERPVGASGKVLIDKDGSSVGYLVLFSDLTRAKETEERLRRSERMAAIGELSADMAHEIRNPLASIRGSVEMLASETDYHGDSMKLMNLVIKETDRLNTIIEHFLRFARAKAPIFQKFSLNTVVREVLDLVRAHPDFREEIELGLTPEDGDSSVVGDPEQIKQVLLNLCLNSLNAMRQGGELSVEVQRGDTAVSVSVRDTGTGMTKGEIDRIFQPFYTTREKGIGLGLSIAHRIMEQHNGWIDVVSTPGKGSRFTVWLPNPDPADGRGDYSE
jgi:two-component system sensor histidine kinase PilS (NtrC family)